MLSRWLRYNNETLPNDVFTSFNRQSTSVTVPGHCQLAAARYSVSDARMLSRCCIEATAESIPGWHRHTTAQRRRQLVVAFQPPGGTAGTRRAGSAERRRGASAAPVDGRRQSVAAPAREDRRRRGGSDPLPVELRQRPSRRRRAAGETDGRRRLADRVDPRVSAGDRRAAGGGRDRPGTCGPGEADRRRRRRPPPRGVGRVVLRLGGPRRGRRGAVQRHGDGERGGGRRAVAGRGRLRVPADERAGLEAAAHRRRPRDAAQPTADATARRSLAAVRPQLVVTPPPIGSAEYCDERVCLSVCVCVCVCVQPLNNPGAWPCSSCSRICNSRIGLYSLHT